MSLPCKERHGLPGEWVNRLASHWYKKKLKVGWKTLDDFLIWSRDHGYEEGARLVILEPKKPAGPDNCIWQPVEPRTQKQCPCDVCPRSPICSSICSQRAKWWDVQMAKVRKNLQPERN